MPQLLSTRDAKGPNVTTPVTTSAGIAAPRLYCGDNLEVLRLLPERCIDLVCIDPPFNANRAFGAYDDRHASTAAYLAFLRPRCAELVRVLRESGSFYCHCDHHASHHVRLMLDELFGPGRLRSEIIWRRTNAKGLAFRGFANNHDTILYYTASDRFTFHRPFRTHDPEYVRRFYRHVEVGTGRRYRLSDLTNPNPDRPNLTYEWNGHVRVWRWARERMEEAHRRGLLHYTSTGLACQKRYLDEMKGRPVDTVWDDIPPVQPHSGERLGYPTQKPVALLERIIAASSNPGDIVLDAFCGCGTALVAAQQLGRRWIGIDVSREACGLTARRLAEVCGLGPGKDFAVD
jgi:DNA modification methylase